MDSCMVHTPGPAYCCNPLATRARLYTGKTVLSMFGRSSRSFCYIHSMRYLTQPRNHQTVRVRKQGSEKVAFASSALGILSSLPCNTS